MGHTSPNCPEPHPIKDETKGEETAMITLEAGQETALSTTDGDYGGPNGWILDSASTVHVCINRELFSEFSEIDAVPIQSGSKQHIKVLGTGTVRIIANIGRGRTHTLVLKNVSYVPEYAANLISLNLVAKVANIHISCGKLTAEKDNSTIFRGTTR